MIITTVKPNNYMDSIFLMKATREVMKLDGVNDAVVVMGSDLNKTVLADFGGLTEEAQNASPNDLIISVDAESADAAERVSATVMKLLTQKDGDDEPTEEKGKKYQSLSQAIGDNPGMNLALISLPSEYAGLEAKRALLSGMHVFIFSDLPLEKEIELKRIGAEKGLLVMGPGAGTAVIDNISIGLMSKVRTGNIGIVAASGSGLQEVAVLVHQKGLGISQAIGTGGRDLSQAVGGSMMLRSIDYLESDDQTDVIVLVSKPPHPDTCIKIFEKVRGCKKAVVVFFLGGDKEMIGDSGAYAAVTLEDAAEAACILAQGKQIPRQGIIERINNELRPIASREKTKLSAGQKYLRGLFCGGTHSEECVMLLQERLPNLHSNIRFGNTKPLQNRFISEQNSLVDMGDEEFTRGRPHPVMDPTILCDRLLQEGKDPETAVILFDIILGHACHEDPVGCIYETIKEIRTISQAEGRYISFVSSICGTELDPQDLKKQVNMLKELGVNVMESNGRAALLAGMILA